MAIFARMISSCAHQCFRFLVLLLISLPVFSEDAAPSGAERFSPESPIQGSGWANIYDPVANSMLVLPYNVIDDMAIYQGDIILGPAAAFEILGPPPDPSVQQGVATASLGRRWDDGIVYYNINGHPESVAILDAMTYLEDNTSIRFVARTSETNYVTFQPSGGCSSFVGRIGGSQNITIGPGCQSRGVVSHEIFHALGVYHEQSRSDRDTYVTISFGNIQAGFEGNFAIASNAIDIGAYNYDSIMHYGNTFFSTGGNTITTIPPGIPIGNRSALSAGDIETMQYLYYTDLQLDLTTASQANPGANVQLDIDIANRGDTDIGDIIAKDVKVSLPLPTQSTYVSFSSSDSWSCSQVAQTVECDIATLARNSDSSLTLNLTAPNSLNSMVVTPTVSASNRDIQTSNDSESETITILNLTDLGVAISTSKSNLNVGESVSVDLVLDNTGSIDAQQVSLIINTPAAMQYNSFTGSGWSCNHAANTTTCTLASLAASGSSNLSVEFDAIAALDNANITAEVSAQNTDGDLSNNSRAASIDIINLTDLAVQISTTSASIDLGDKMTLNVDLENRSPTTVQNINLEVVTPATNLKFLEAVGTNWNCNHSGNTTSCSLATLTSSANSQLSVNFKAVKKSSSASISATVSTPITDINTTNNSDSLSLKINKDDSSSSSSGSGAFDRLFLFILALSLLIRKRLLILGKTRTKQMLGFSVFALLIPACQVTNADAEKIILVDKTMVDCQGVAPQKCMKIREPGSDQWTLFYSQIEGFNHLAGYDYKLLIRTYDIDNPPADASSIGYQLVKVIEKNCNGC